MFWIKLGGTLRVFGINLVIKLGWALIVFAIGIEFGWATIWAIGGGGTTAKGRLGATLIPVQEACWVKY